MQLRDDEVLIVTRLLDELGELLGDDDVDESSDPTVDGLDDEIAGLSWPDADPVTLPTDPALRRLKLGLQATEKMLASKRAALRPAQHAVSQCNGKQRR